MGTWEIDVNRTLQETKRSQTLDEAMTQKLSARITADAERMKLQVTDTNLVYTIGKNDTLMPYSLVSSDETGMTVTVKRPAQEVTLVFTLIDGEFMNMRSTTSNLDPVNRNIWKKAVPIIYAVSPPAPETVARSFSFPGTITFTDEKRRKTDYDNAGNRIWARYYESVDHTFAGTAVILYERGTHLSANMRQRLESALANYNTQMEKLRQDAIQHGRPDPLKDRAAQVETEGAPIRIIDLPDKRRGYVYMAGMGPGGWGLAASLPSKDGKYDLLLVTSFPGESGQFDSSANTKDYYESLRQRPYSSLQQAVIKLDSLMFP